MPCHTYTRHHAPIARHVYSCVALPHAQCRVCVVPRGCAVCPCRGRVAERAARINAASDQMNRHGSARLAKQQTGSARAVANELG